MRIYENLQKSRDAALAARPRWIPHPNPKYATLWRAVLYSIAFFLSAYVVLLLLPSSFAFGLSHPVTITCALITFFVPIIILTTAYIQFKRSEPDDMYLTMLGAWMFRLFIFALAGIALIISADRGFFTAVFIFHIIAFSIIEMLAYLAYRSYSGDQIREIIYEDKTFSDVNEDNEFWFLTRGGDVGADRLLIKSKWHLKVFYAVGAVAPLAFVSGAQISAPIVMTFVALAMYFISHGMYTGVYVVRRGLQLRLEGKL